MEKMQIDIDKIKVKKRVRKNLGDLELLKESLNRYGLLNPITINAKNELVAGARRLECAKMLGWKSIEAKITDISGKADLLELEIEENTVRLPFSEEELLEGYNKLSRLRRPHFFSRVASSIKEFFTGISETSAEKKQAKIISAFKLSLLLPLGILIIITGAIFYKINLFSSLVRTFTDVIAIALIIIGALFLTRHIMLKK